MINYQKLLSFIFIGSGVLKLPAKITKRKKWYLASCPVLDVHSQGETEGKARKNLAEAVSLFLASCIERNTLDAVLKECGLRFATPSGRFIGNLRGS